MTYKKKVLKIEYKTLFSFFNYMQPGAATSNNNTFIWFNLKEFILLKYVQKFLRNMHLYTEYKNLNDTKITRKTMLNIERIHKNIHNFETSAYFTV